MTDKIKDISAMIPQSEYDALIGRIDNLWTLAKNRAVEAINTGLLDANWQTGLYIVDFEHKGQIRAEYGKFLIPRLAKDLTVRRGKGFSRYNLIYMRNFYLYFPKGVTVSHLLSWSHYYELLKNVRIKWNDNSIIMRLSTKNGKSENYAVRLNPHCSSVSH